MNELTKRRLKANEVVFREANLAVSEFVEAESGNHNKEVAFYCECSMARCRSRIKMTTSEYSKAHSNDKRFITLPGHEQPAVEKIVKLANSFNIVEKFGSMPSPASIDVALSKAAIEAG